MATVSDDAILLVPAAALIWCFLAGLVGMYHVDERRIECSVADELGSVVQLTAVWTWLVFLLDVVGSVGATPVTPALLLWLVSIPLLLLMRAIARRVAERQDWYRQSAIVVGHPGDIDRVSRILRRHPEYGIVVAHELELAPTNGLDRVGQLIELAEAEAVDRVLFASSYEGLDERTGALRFLADRGVKVDLVPGDSEVFRSDAELHFIEGLPLLTLPTTRRPRSARLVKRTMDLVGASFGLVVLSPLFAYCAARIKLDSPGPVLFRQSRIGMKNEHFKVIKFRTMETGADDRKHEVVRLNSRTDGMFKIADGPRITAFGRRLRRWWPDPLKSVRPV